MDGSYSMVKLSVPYFNRSIFRSYWVFRCTNVLMGIDIMYDNLLILGENDVFTYKQKNMANLGESLIVYANSHWSEVLKSVSANANVMLHFIKQPRQPVN